MNNILELAMGMRKELVNNRRTIHRYAETGFDVEQTVEFVTDQLKSYGYSPMRVGKAGVICTAGKGGKTLLLRADMDALPMEEKSGLEYAASNGHAHTCGHDAHTAMLLGAAKIVKQRETELKGTVKFMFQPAEEILKGSQDMIADGLLKNPVPDAAFALHVLAGRTNTQSGTLFYKSGTMNKSGDALRITVTGKEAHGARPYLGVDAVTIAAHIVVALNELIAKEIPSSADCSILVGKIQSGNASNIVAGEAIMELSLRTDDVEFRKTLLKRIEEIAECVAKTYRGSVSVEHLFGAPSMYNDPVFASQMESFTKELLGEDSIHTVNELGGGDDFAEVAEKIPAALFFLGVGSIDEGYTASIHQPGFVLNEDVLPVGTALLAYNASRWLEE